MISGCLNGGAQTRPDAGTTAREHLQQVEQLYQTLPKSQPDNAEVAAVYQLLDGADSDLAKKQLHTEYHAVEKMNTALNIKW